MKNVRIRSFSGRYFHALELRTEIYSVYLRIQSKCGKMRTRKTLEKDTFYEIQTSCEILHVKSYVIFEFQFKDQEKEMIYYCKSTREIPSQLRESVVSKIVEEFQMFVSVKQFRFEILLKSYSDPYLAPPFPEGTSFF